VSVKIMSAIFDSKTLGPTERLVMLALADHADDEGRCYPSIARLCERTGLSERAVQSHVKALTAAGYLAVMLNAGPKGCNVYFVRPAPPQDMHPAVNAPRRTCALPPQDVRPTPAGRAPEPSGTINEPPKENGVSFAEFWDRWPEKKAKVSAEKAWARLPAEDRRVASARCADWFRAWRRGNPQASPIHAATFLNQRRWQDMDETSSTQNPNAVAEFWAKHLNDPAARVPQTAISPSLARLMLELRLVTPETLKRRGFAA
jgi:hypothetical protein